MLDTLTTAFAEFQRAHNGLCEECQAIAFRFQVLMGLLQDKGILTFQEYQDKFHEVKRSFLGETTDGDPNPEVSTPDSSDRADNDVHDGGLDNGESPSLDDVEESTLRGTGSLS